MSLLCLQQQHISKKIDGHVAPSCPGDPSLPLSDNQTLPVWAQEAANHAIFSERQIIQTNANHRNASHIKILTKKANTV